MHRFNRQYLKYTSLFLVVVIAGVLISLLDIEPVNKNILSILTFALNGIVIVIAMLKGSQNGYSLKDIVLSFLFLFMFISPLVQYLRGSFPWGDSHLLTDDKVIRANLLVLVFMIIFLFTFSFFQNEPQAKVEKEVLVIGKLNIILDILFIASLLFSLFIIFNVGISNLFSRATYSIDTGSSSFNLIVVSTFRSTSVIYLALNILFFLKHKKIYRMIPFIIGVILMLLVNFPTGSSRFWMASVYLGLIFIIKRKYKNPHWLKLIIILGMLVLFPAINVFRRNTFQEALSLGIEIPKPSDAFIIGDYDSYSMLVRSIIYVANNGIKWGYQLLGSVLFFVPRKVWPTKPIGSGVMMATELGWDFTNVSCPFIGESYLNFGFLGVVIFAFGLAYISKWADKRYNEAIDQSTNSISFIELVYPFSLGFLFYIMRGDLLSSLSYYLGFMLPIIIIWAIQKISLIGETR